MRAIDFIGIGPDFRSLFTEGCFAQRPMISGSKLRVMATERRMLIPLFPEKTHLEPMSALGAFVPIAFQIGAAQLETFRLHPNPEYLEWSEEGHALPWISHGWITDTITTPVISERYSPWQVLYLDEALRMLARAQAESSPAPEILKQAQILDEEWRPLIKLLVALQSRLWSYRRGRSSLVYDDLNGERIDVTSWAASWFDPDAVLRRFDLSLNRVAEIHMELIEAAQGIDPLPQWHELSETAHRDITDQFRGEALRARDLYDAAYLLRGFYFLATENWLPRADQLRLDNTVSYDRRRHLPVLPQTPEARRKDLKETLIHLSLYPHRIHFFVEGATEHIVVSAVLDLIGLGSEESGMAVTSIDSVDALKRHEVIVRSANHVAAKTVLIADREGTLMKMLGRLRAEGLFTHDEDVLLWGEDGQANDFEEANFTDDEILEAVKKAARRRDLSVELDLSIEEVRRLRTAQSSRPRKPPPLGRFMLDLAQEHHVRVSKRELAESLAEMLVQEIEEAGDMDTVGEKRPIIRRMLYWVRRDRELSARTFRRSS